MFPPINLSAYADPILDQLHSGEPKLDGTIFWEITHQTQGPILELGCGYGRLTIPLAQRGIQDITGVELSAPSLAYAREKAGDLPIRWVEGDVRDFHLDRRFQLIFARGNVFDFMLMRTDQEAMLSSVREHLAEDGVFLFDISYLPPERMVSTTEEVEWFTLTHPNGRKIYVTGTDEFDFSKQQWTQTCYERWDQPGGELVRSPWALTLRYTMPQEMETFLHYNGFEILSKYAEWDGTLETKEIPASIYLCKIRK